MIVSRLIQLLENRPPFMEVMIDVTLPGAKMIKMCNFDSVEEVVTSTGEEFVLLFDSESFTNEKQEPSLN